MNDPKKVVVNMPSRTSGRWSVGRRIERRLEVLREWLSEGVPVGKRVPNSLAQAREWEDAELGVFSIASPNEFTMTHPLYGSLVKDIAGLLTALKNKFKQPKSSKSRSSNPTLKFDRSALERQITYVVSQWHTERAQLLQEKKRADSAELRCVILLNEIKQKDQLISDLRSQLVFKQGLRAVE